MIICNASTNENTMHVVVCMTVRTERLHITKVYKLRWKRNRSGKEGGRTQVGAAKTINISHKHVRMRH